MKYVLEKATGEIYGVNDSAAAEDYPPADWAFDISVNMETLAAIAPKYRVVIDGVLAERTQDDKDSVDAAVLSAIKSAQKAALAIECQAYIESKCPPHNQNTLNGLYVAAGANRKAHIKGLWDWVETVITYNQSKQTFVDLAGDVAAVEAITQDFSDYDATWPNVTITTTRAIED